jgi:Arc/MetJ-type ribon-helix-helix transcriptional regulator
MKNRRHKLDGSDGMTHRHTKGVPMPKSKVAISVEKVLLTRIDQLARQGVFANRSQAIEIALREKLARLERGRLSREAAKLDPLQEQSMAEEGLSEDESAWPEY